jgi:small subunit ribosomal protein S6
MPYYESVFIARQDVSASAAETLADKFADILKTNGGSVSKREYWGLRPLAYRIKKNKKGHYFLFNTDAPPQAIQEMERYMRLDEDVLRFLTLRIEEIDETPSIMMQNRGRHNDESGDSPSSKPSKQEPKAEIVASDKSPKNDLETSDEDSPNAAGDGDSKKDNPTNEAGNQDIIGDDA